MSKIECLAVIPARGGSKGVPRKNIRAVAGVPLIAHVIRAAQDARSIDRFVVSTDDAEIAAIAERFGAESLQRPADISGDTASSESAVLHCLDQLESRDGYRPDLVMLIQCTSPLTTSEDLDRAVHTLLEQHADSCFTAVPFFHFLWNVAEDGTASGINHAGKKRKRRQDLAPQYLENGAAYVMRTEAFLKTGERFCGKTVLCVVPEEHAIEIDSPLDLVKAEVVMRAAGASRSCAALPECPQALVMDFDGVLTDNAVFVDQDGREQVRCDRGDGLGLEILRKQGLRMLILSKERNPVVARRAEKLQIQCIHGVDGKADALTEWAKIHQIALSNIVYIGNDANDIAPMQLVGCAVCPADAHPTAKAHAQIILRHTGGRGAVRELCELLSTCRP